MPEYALDANVFIHTAGRTVPFDDAVTVPAIVDELDSEEAHDRFDRSDVAVYQPGEEYVEQVRAAADQLGNDLSSADTQLLALAVDRGAVAVTDDYGVQNVAEALDIEYVAFDKEGIEEQIEWTTVCDSCGADMDGERCSRCGGEPRQVPAD
ncbi:MAG: DNA-binding protein [Candidatus Nanohaloarchaea archaeon]|nr:DNA-binding protein [Candidatus Nanohaloarchaea archaeon]